MTRHHLSLPGGNSQIDLELPSNWHICGVLEPASPAPADDPRQAVRNALRTPIGMPRLGELAHAGMRVTLVCDDLSRPTPVGEMIPVVLEELDLAGVKRDDVRVVFALGLHRPMTDDEIRSRIGNLGLAYENHDCDDMTRLDLLGTTARGTTVWVNQAVARADVVVSLGCIEPHIIASFGGGYKNLVPGVAGRVTVAHNHSLNCAPGTFNMVGQPIQQNPMRLDLEEASQMLRPPVFIVNAVLNSRQEIVRVVAGNALAAHRQGVQISSEIYGVRVPAAADVVIANSHPMDQDLRQGVKALANTIRAVKRGGVQITFVRAEEGVGVFGLANRKLPLGRGAIKALAPILLSLVPRLKLKGMGEEDRFFLYFALQATRHCALEMYAPTIPAEVQSRLPFVDFMTNPQQAINCAERTLGKAAEVLVFPYGGTTFPILPGN